MNNVGMTWAYGHVSTCLNNKEVDWHTDLWKERYPALLELEHDQPQIPKNNVMRNNFRFNSLALSLSAEVISYGTYEDNVAITLENGTFTEFFEGDYMLTLYPGASMYVMR